MTNADRTLSLEGSFWRELARWGSRRGPGWFVRYSPPLVGLAACAVAPRARRQVFENLRRVRGPRGVARDAVDVARTFASYASCLAETLAAGSEKGASPRAAIWGEHHFLDAVRDARGVVLVTAHTAGWEIVGPLLSRDHELRLLIAEEAERDPGARRIQDGARSVHGVQVAHVGDDPLAGLALAKHLREGGAVAVQLDRLPAAVRGRKVVLFGAPARVPEGPLRLAMITGAPLLPVFAARTGHRTYGVVIEAPIRLARGAREGDLDSAAQRLADAMERFLRSHPTQWFHFREG